MFFYWKDHLEGGQLSQQLTSYKLLFDHSLIDLLSLNPTKTLSLDGVSFADLLTQKVYTLPQRTLYTFAMNQEKFKGAIRIQQHRLTITGENDYQLTNLLEGSRRNL
ncbi:MAG: hypothetical protein ACI9CQ_004457 [Saprospiraceae bacterium]